MNENLTTRIAAACGAGVLLLGAAACGSDDPANAGADSGTNAGPGTTQQDGAQDRTQGGQRPGANGKVAAVSGSTAQVQSMGSGQVAVTWTASTAFTKQVSAKLADLSVGDCVVVTPVDSDDGTGATTPPTAVTASSVRITEKVDGSCSPVRVGRPGGGSGGGPQLDGDPGGGATGARPTRGGFGGAFGEVKAVAANSFVVTTEMPTGDDPTKTTSTEVTVTVGKATTYRTTAPGSAADVKVGVCVNADGKTDDTGAVTATRIAVTPTVEGECSGGMVRFSSGAPGSAS
ncbi:hypothetical protein EFK50_15335 [Nocardioides marmoriginsengisoli]|uniref:DUF5666 domain-containing protein n=1 Tax=Nocardioides marmoriginsengisoli TaxID=661483 RepID=A0A3N0CI26_9ACTN|nr:DUF5666 domain-containing protein [Nocardioides marmoriginsengisoli]RNL63084.1 hypothetical protein EFK50_15335 [Nocardioides marmoriginsengisoli]